MRARFTFFLLIVSPALIFAQQVELVNDFNSGITSNPVISDIVELNGVALFVHSSPETGQELFISDGTENGTVLVNDINPGTAASYPQNLVAFNGELYFTADDGSSGRRIWKSDGTEEGTVMVLDSAICSGNNFRFGIGGGVLYFTGGLSGYNEELWKTDGTKAGTMLVKEINPFSSSYPGNYLDFGGKVYFTADDGSNGAELWCSDGTPEGTVMVKDINPGAGYSNPYYLTDAGNGIFFFAADNGSNGQELWKSDGTDAGTVLVKDIKSGSNSSYPSRLTMIGNTVYFAAETGTDFNDDLWKSDGTSAGTVMVKDMGSYSPDEMAAFGSKIVFTNFSGDQLWVSDGTASGTKAIHTTINDIEEFGLSGGSMFFTAKGIDNEYGSELWITDGTAGGTTKIKDFHDGFKFYPARHLTDVNGTLFLAVSEPGSGPELWISDGTEAGTELTRDINQNTQPSSPYIYPFKEDRSILALTVDTLGRELYITDGTGEGTTLLKDIFPGSVSSLMHTEFDYAVAGDYFYFPAYDTFQHEALWKTDGTPEGTSKVFDIFPEGQDNIQFLTALDDRVVFSAWKPETGTELWISDGTPEGSFMLKDIDTNVNTGSNPYPLIEYNNEVYFSAQNPEYGAELWKTDGTPEGTVMVKDIVAGSGHSRPGRPVIFNDTLYFIAANEFSYTQLWKTDGTGEGTVMVKDFEGPKSVSEIVVFNDTIYFPLNTTNRSSYWYSSYTYLWKSDGTEEGTVRVQIPGVVENPAHLTVCGDYLYFSSESFLSDTELWRTDGTIEGYQLVKDIGDTYNVSSSSPENLMCVGNTLYFSAANETYGRELWKTSGEDCNTVRLSDLRTGKLSSSPTQLTALGDYLLFSANHETYGNELFRIRNIEKEITSQPADLDICEGSSGQLSVGLSDDTGSILWFRDGIALEGETGENLSFADANLSNEGQYYAQIAYDACDTLRTDTVWVNVHPVFEHEESLEICYGETYVFPDGTAMDPVIESTVYTSNLTSVLGCDSVIITTLDVLPVYNEKVEASICAGETFSFGSQLLTEPGEYTEVFTSVSGCDSTVILTLSLNSLDTEVVVAEGILTVNEENAVYEWVKCDGSGGLKGVTGRSYKPEQNGDYFVIVEKNGCVDTSECVEVLISNIPSFTDDNSLAIYPNPAENWLTVSLPTGYNPETSTDLIISDLNGRILHRERIYIANEYEIDIQDLEPGTYFLIILTEDLEQYKTRFIRQ